MQRLIFQRLVFALVVAMLVVAGCAERAPVARDLPVLNNDLPEGQLTRSHAIAGEEFAFKTSYFTDYDTRRWRVTDSKTLRMTARISDISERGKGVEVLIEHVHIDIAIKSKYALMDGWPQDSMDDSMHTGNQPGFWINEKYPYENTFAIEGFSENLLSGWGIFTSDLGYAQLKDKRLTEENLVDSGGVYGNKVQVIYDLLVKYPDEPYYHTRSVVDEFLIPVGR
jgi:hypothetical protein